MIVMSRRIGLGLSLDWEKIKSSRLQAVQRNALNAENGNIQNSLNLDEIVRRLKSYSLLTSDELYRLMNSDQPTGKRIDYLIEILPRKNDWWEILLQCLDGSSTEPGLGAHKTLANQLRERLTQQLSIKNYEQKRYLMLLPMMLLQRFTIKHQKTVFKMATIFAILILALCILEGPSNTNTFIITSLFGNDSILESKHDVTSSHIVMNKLAPAVDNVKNATVIALQHSNITATQSLVSKEDTSKSITLTNPDKKSYKNKQTNNHARTQPTNKSHALVTSQELNNRRVTLTTNTSKTTIKGEKSLTKYLTTSKPDDLEVMQKQLYLMECLLFYIEKEKVEIAELDLWRAYVALKKTSSTGTAIEKHMILLIEDSTGWTTDDLTVKHQIEHKLSNTIQSARQMKKILSITNITAMRVTQQAYKFEEQLLLKEMVVNYQTENALLRLKHKLYVRQPTVSPNAHTGEILVTLIYYPLLQKYVSLLVDTFAAKNACLKAYSFL